MQCITTSEARPRRRTQRPCAGMHTMWKHTPYGWSGGNSEQETAASLGFARALPLSRSLQLSFILRILLVQAHTFNVVEGTGHRRFSSVSLTMSTAKLVSSRSVGFRTHLYLLLAIVTSGFCTCLAIVPVSAAVFHLRMLHCTGHGVRSQRSKIGPKISQISRYIGQIRWRFEIDRPKGLKEARRYRSVRKLLFPFARVRAKCGRNGPSMHTHGGIRVRQTPKVLGLRRSFARAGETKFALKWVGRTDRARNKALWTHQGP